MKIIKVTSTQDDTPIFFNVDKIESIFVNHNNETTIGTTQSIYTCKESTEEIYQKIKEAEND